MDRYVVDEANLTSLVALLERQKIGVRRIDYIGGGTAVKVTEYPIGAPARVTRIEFKKLRRG